MLQLTDSRPALYLLALATAILAGRLIAAFLRPKTTTAAADRGDEKRPKTWVPVAFSTPAPAPYPGWDVHTTKPLAYRPFKYGPR